MKVLIFLEAIVSLEIIWNMLQGMQSKQVPYIITGIVIHYLNFLIKCILVNVEVKKWQQWITLMFSDVISQGLLSLIWNEQLILVQVKKTVQQVLIVVQTAWANSLFTYYFTGIVLMLYFCCIQIFEQSDSLTNLIKTIIIAIMFSLIAYKMKPQPIEEKEQLKQHNLQISLKFDIKQHILELVPWLSEQKFIVLNEKLLVLYDQAQLLQFFDGQEETQVSDTILAQYLLDSKCESLSIGLLKLLQGPFPKKKAFFKPDIKSICTSILENSDSIYQYYSAGDIESRQFKLSNFKLNFIVLSDLQQFENILIIHLEQQLEKKTQFSKSLHTISAHQNVSSVNQSKTTENNNTISSQLLNNIFQSVSHEFGTYLNCIMTVSQEALNNLTIKNDVKQTYFEPIQINSQLLYYILRNIRDYNSILLNQFTLRLQEFSPYQMIKDIVGLMDKQLEFRLNKVKIDCPIDLKVYNDAERYKQIIYQLLSNSARFTQDGIINIDVIIDKDKLKTKILDSGIGMTTQESQKLTEMLKDSKKMLRVSRNSVGCGLGLSISNAIVQKMNGKKGLEFKTTQNKGTEFFFSIRNSQQLYNESVYQTSHTYLKVVNQIYYMEQQPSEPSIKQMMMGSKYESSQQSQSNSGGLVKQARALSQKRKQSAETQKQFLYRLSEINQQQEQDSVYDQNDDEDDDENDNDSRYSKQPPLMIPSIETNFKTQIVQFDISSKCCSRVLIVDDEVFNILSMQLILSRFQVKTDRAFNGAEAIKKCDEKKLNPCKYCCCSGYVIIFLDLNMPVMNGFDAVKIIKSKIKAGQIPRGLCIANTGYSDLETKQLAIQQGMDFYLTKPIDVQELETYLRKKFPLNF